MRHATMLLAVVVLGVASMVLVPERVLAQVVNGSFEADSVTFPGWSVTGNIKLLDAFATDGIRTANFNYGNAVPNAVLSQAIPTVAGCSDTLYFDFGVRSFNGINQSIKVEVLGTQILAQGIFSGTALAPTPTLTTRVLTFVPDGPVTVIKFTDVTANTTTATDGVLDNVRVMVGGCAPTVTTSSTWGSVKAGAKVVR